MDNREILKKANQEDIVCVYHSADLDGICSAAIVYSLFPRAQFIGYNYRKPMFLDRLKNKHVIMVDVSLNPFVLMEQVAYAAQSFTWIDHHKSAIEQLNTSGLLERDNVEVYCDVEEKYAACWLTWSYFYIKDQKQNRLALPDAIELLSLYDTWRWETHERKDAIISFQYGMRSLGMKYNALMWNVFFQADRGYTGEIEGIYRRGEIILSYQKQQYEIAAKSAFLTWVQEVPAIAINIGGANSMVFDSVYDSFAEKWNGHVLLVTFVWTHGKWRVSLYTRSNEIDCGAIAKSLGGGGHRKAAGFRCSKLPFELLG